MQHSSRILNSMISRTNSGSSLGSLFGTFSSSTRVIGMTLLVFLFMSFVLEPGAEAAGENSRRRTGVSEVRTARSARIPRPRTRARIPRGPDPAPALPNAVSQSENFRAPAVGSPLFELIVSKGVPRASLTRIVEYMRTNDGRSINQETYECTDRSPNSETPCHESRRIRQTRAIQITQNRYAGVIDYSLPSAEKRFFIIDLESGEVVRIHAAHGSGSGRAAMVMRFSNRPNSRATSLGLYQMGGVYQGGWGPAIRMYGLERSNDQAYNRDIVLHGATYASEAFVANRGRLGTSWGCPTVHLRVIERLTRILSRGALVDFYHPAVNASSQTGADIVLSTQVQEDSEDQDDEGGDAPRVRPTGI